MYAAPNKIDWLGNLTQKERTVVGDEDSPGQKAVEGDELLLPDGPDVVLEGPLQLAQLVAQLHRRRRVVPSGSERSLVYV